MKMIKALCASFMLLFAGHTIAAEKDSPVLGEGRMIPVKTSFGTFKVWTKKMGDNPKVKVLLLHGGPGATHEYYENFAKHLPQAGYEIYFYDQLGSYFSDQPDDPRLLDIDRFVDEVDQVRTALGMNKDNFYLLGHSWGGLLAMEYALAHQDVLKGLIISNMIASIPDYIDYANNVLMPSMDQDALKEIKAIEAAEDYSNPRYEELLMEHHYQYHVLRRPPEEWPDSVVRAFAHINPNVYIPMQGPSELGASGILADWDRKADLHKIKVPVLSIAGEFDTMEPKQMELIANSVQHGRYLFCPDAGHMAMYDAEDVYFDGLIKFLADVDSGNF